MVSTPINLKLTAHYSISADFRPAPFALHSNVSNQRTLADYLWIAYYNQLWAIGKKLARVSLVEGAFKGTGLFLQGILGEVEPPVG